MLAGEQASKSQVTPGFVEGAGDGKKQGRWRIQCVGSQKQQTRGISGLAVASGVEWHVAVTSPDWFCGLNLAVALATPDILVLPQPLGLVCSVPDESTSCPIPFQ